MGVLAAFHGAAGTGKTHRLVGFVEERAMGRTWSPHECVLGLTFMHGARRLMLARLARLRAHGVPAMCATLDSFCLSVVRRYRRYLGVDGTVEVVDSAPEERKDRARWCCTFSTLREATVGLLADGRVAPLVRVAFPLILVDEFQDCEAALLGLVRSLSEVTDLCVAGDGFQALREGGEDPEAMAWLAGAPNAERLVEVKRTNGAGLLAAAHALRNESATNNSIRLLCVNGGGLAAWEIAKRLAWSGWQGGSLAVISPVRPSRSDFVAQTYKSLGKPLGTQTKIGPFPLRAEENDAEAVDRVRDTLRANESDRHFDLPALRRLRQDADPLVRATARSALRSCNLTGASGCDGTTFLAHAKERSRDLRAFGSGPGPRARIGVTVHGAKNREFERVAILWPYEVAGDETFQRRLLYNAVTRARRDAVLLVQGKEDRVKRDPVLRLLAPT